MSPMNTSLQIENAAIPFNVKVEPRLVESLCGLARLGRERGHYSDISGLLFGKAERGIRTLEALKAFSDGGPFSELARRQRMESAYTSALEEAKNDPELSKLEVVGWFSFRTGSGLVSSDVVFHNQHFRQPEDLALIAWREGLSQVTVEFYSKSDQETLTSDDYRWASIRFSAEIRHMRDAVEVAMRAKTAEDAYLLEYDTEESESRWAGIMRRAGAITGQLFGSQRKRRDDEVASKLGSYPGGRTTTGGMKWAPETAAGPNVSAQPNFKAFLEAATENQRPAADFPARSAVASAAAGPFPVWPGSPNSIGAAPLSTSPKAETRFPDPVLTQERVQVGGPTHPELTRLGPPPAPKHSGSGSLWLVAAAIFLVCAGTVFTFLALGLQNESGRLGQLFQSIFPGDSLNLRVQNNDDRLRLTWNQRNSAVLSATDGTLEIFDGQQHRQVHLDGRQVADGSVLYKPITNDVTFHLDVHGEKGGASGSIRVLDGLTSQPEPLDVSAPPTATNAPIRRNPLGFSESAAARNYATPTLLRPDAAADAHPPISEAPGVPKPLASSPKAVTRRYVNPQNIGAFPDATLGGVGSSAQNSKAVSTPIPSLSGSTINSWDTPARTPAANPGTTYSGPASAGYAAPRPLFQVMPQTSGIPNGAIQSRTRVEVQVRIDPVGKVESAHVVGGSPNESVASAALAAARQWTFEPASQNGHPVEGDHTIVFEFRPQR